ncbi:hypothetical protein EDD21DRAFT_340490 [Dissophora ornata]|nr:hypothetical protein EDD21DRAFT_340490 [Dissophora ornata]
MCPYATPVNPCHRWRNRTSCTQTLITSSCFLIIIFYCCRIDKWSKTVIEQEQEAKKEATNPTIPMAIPEGSNESTGLSVPDLERSLKNKTSGYLEKMSKAILSSKSTDTVPMMSAAATADTASTIPVATTAKTEHGGNHKNDKQLDEFGDNEFRVQKLPRVFHPL